MFKRLLFTKLPKRFKEPIYIPLPIGVINIPTPLHRKNGNQITLFNAIALTVWPFVFYTNGARDETGELAECINQHELVHWRHQRNMGTVVGFALWLVAYVFLLVILPPLYWVFLHRHMRIEEHPFEADAYAAQRACMEEVD